MARRSAHQLAFLSLGVIASLGLAVELAYYWLAPGIPVELVAFFSLSYEENLPTWYSSSLLLACAFALAYHARRVRETARAHPRHWSALALIFAYMSLDEVAQLHERLGGIVEADGVLYFSWVIPAGIAVLLGGLAFLPFVLHLDRETRHRFVVSGLIYVGGALGIELPLGYWTECFGGDNLGYALLDFVEETLEMLGATLFLLAILDLLRRPITAAKASER